METMVRRAATCDAGRLEQLLRDRLPEEARRDLETHLFLCPACRDQLDKLAGGPPWWGEVRRYLGEDGAAEPVLTMEHSAPRRWPDVELDFLEASDNPAALGRLGGYEVLEILGRGAWGVVLKAFDPSLHRPVAIKVLAEGSAANGTARKRFAREARAAAAVVHDHVVPVYAVNADATPPYLVMAFIPGQSLQERIDRSGPLELKEILRIGTQTASGLAAAHAQGLVHRDIKPANIMLENGVERVRITDFGLARAVDDASVTRTGSVAGTPQYMAPEQARGEAVDQRADLFALGSTLYAMCTGQAPFRGESAVAVVRQVCDVEPRPIRAIDSELPVWLEGIVRKLQAKDPARRFQTAAEVADLLEHCLAHVQHPDRHPLPVPAAELGRQVPDLHSRPSARRRWQAAAAAVAIALLSGAVLFTLARPARIPVGDDGGSTSASEGPATSTAIPPVASEDEIRDRFDGLRTEVEALQQSLADELRDGWNSPSGASGDPGQTAQQLARKAERLRRELSPGTEEDFDPVERQMETIRARLEALRQQLGVRSE
jgi:serine/threonine protein kinase